MKRIKLELTEDQVRWLVSATVAEIDYWTEAKEKADATGWNEQQEAFGKRILTKLSKELVKL